mgnify:CR=1 FL=1
MRVKTAWDDMLFLWSLMFKKKSDLPPMWWLPDRPAGMTVEEYWNMVFGIYTYQRGVCAEAKERPSHQARCNPEEED